MLELHVFKLFIYVLYLLLACLLETYYQGKRLYNSDRYFLFKMNSVIFLQPLT